MDSRSVVSISDRNQPDLLIQKYNSSKENMLQESILERKSIIKTYPSPIQNSHSDGTIKDFTAHILRDSVKVRPYTDCWQTIFNLVPLKVGLHRLLMFLLNVCLPVCGSSNPSSSCEQCTPTIVCLPSQPDLVKPKEKVKEPKPIGLITRNKDMELFKGKLVYKCTCGMRNGLSGQHCPRMSCINNPGCSMIPPQCWPQFPDPPKPPVIPEQKMICVPLELVYYDPSQPS